MYTCHLETNDFKSLKNFIFAGDSYCDSYLYKLSKLKTQDIALNYNAICFTLH